MMYEKNFDVSEMRNKHFVYFLFYGNEIVYIGQTTNLFLRLGQHLNEKNFDGFNFVISDSLKHALRLEFELICKHKPKFNLTKSFSLETGYASKIKLKSLFNISGHKINKILKNNNILSAEFKNIKYFDIESFSGAL